MIGSSLSKFGIGAVNPYGVLTIGRNSTDGTGDPREGIVFADTVNGLDMAISQAWTHASIYTVGSAGWNGDLLFATDGNNAKSTGLTEKMRITHDGYIGIGTATPNKDLHVYNTVANAEIDLQSVAGGNKHWGIYVNAGANASDNSFKIWQTNDRLILDKNGNLSIPTGSISSRFIHATDTSITANGFDYTKFNSMEGRLVVGVSQIEESVYSPPSKGATLYSYNDVSPSVIYLPNQGTTAIFGKSTQGHAGNFVSGDPNNSSWAKDSSAVVVQHFTKNNNVSAVYAENFSTVTTSKAIYASSTGGWAGYFTGGTGKLFAKQICLGGETPADCKTSWTGSTGGSQWVSTTNPTGIAYTGGNVGIGINKSSTTLHVLSGASTSNALVVGADIAIFEKAGVNTGQIKIVAPMFGLLKFATPSNPNAAAVYYADNIKELSLQNAGQNIVNVSLTRTYITNNVGIGTSTPNSDLHVYNTVANAEIDIQSVAGTGEHWGVYQQGTDDTATTGYNDTGDLRFWQDSNRIVFGDNGRVGIGTANLLNNFKLIIGNGSGNGNNISINGAANNFVGTQVAVNGVEKWFSGMSSSSNFVIRANGNKDVLTASANSITFGADVNTANSLSITNNSLYVSKNSTVGGDRAAIISNYGPGFALEVSNYSTNASSKSIYSVTDKGWSGWFRSRNAVSPDPDYKGVYIDKLCLGGETNADCKTSWPTGSTTQTYATPTLAQVITQNPNAGTIDNKGVILGHDQTTYLNVGGAIKGSWLHASATGDNTILGKLGIGTNTTPLPNPEQLQILGTSAGSEGARIVNAFVGEWPKDSTFATFMHADLKESSSTGYALLQSFDGTTYLNSASGKNIVFRNNNVDKVTLTFGGRIGIGISAPNSDLHIYNAASNAEIDLQSGSNGHWGIYQQGSDNASTTNYNEAGDLRFWQGSDRVVFADNGSVGIGTNTPASTLKLAVNGNVGAAKYCDANGANCKSITDLIASSSLWTVSGANIYRGSGNVGIGTTSPNSIFSVSSNSTGPSRIDVANTNSAGYVSYRLDAGSNVGALVLNGHTMASNPDLMSLMNVNGDISFISGGNNTTFEKMRIVSATGNVGIGTANPGAKLVVKGSGTGNVMLGEWESLNYGGISMNGSMTVGNYNVLSSLSDQNLYLNRPTGYSMNFRMNNSDQMVIASTSNVGIGTTTPVAKLTVQGAGDLSVDLLVNGRIRSNSNNGGMWVSNDRFVGGLNTDQIGFYNKGWAFIVNSSHNVGIGTTSPTAKLEVNGQVKIVDGTQGLNKVLTSNADGLASWRTASSIESDPKVGSLSTYTIPKWGLAGSNSLIDSGIYESGNGQVGIGTKQPLAIFHVSGTSMFSGSMTVKGNISSTGNTTINGNATVTGKANLGYQQVKEVCDNNYECTATCLSNYKVVGGGCNTASGSKIEESYPGTDNDGEMDNSWHCHQDSKNSIKVFAICLRVE
jgi:hypothetical protein